MDETIPIRIQWPNLYVQLEVPTVGRQASTVSLLQALGIRRSMCPFGSHDEADHQAEYFIILVVLKTYPKMFSVDL